MKCFNHAETDALGTCKSCSKGICSLCLVDVGRGLACKNSCENDVRVLKQCEAQAHGSGMFARPIVASIGSALMIGVGMYSHHFFVSYIGAGVVFAALAFWETSRVLKARKSRLLPQEPVRHEIDFLDHEFKKLERESKQTKDPP